MVDLDIVNRALAFLGAHDAESMSDTATSAAKAIAAYEKCRDEVLRMAHWTCALKRGLLKDCGAQATPWKASHTYGVGERVTNDTLKTYTCSVAGKSATAGGPTGTGEDIADGTAEWDYVEPSTALTNWCHRVSTSYEVGDIVTWDCGKVYVCIQAGTSAAANQPVGTAPDIVDGNVRWKYYATIKPNLTIYSYQYVLPTDCKRAMKLPDPYAAAENDEGIQYKIEGKFLYTNLADATLLYVALVDVDEWDSLLQGTVALRIAAEIAFNVTGKKDLVQLAFQALAGQYADARRIAMNEGQEAVPEQVKWEDA